ncbi:MAG: hypothetical protein HRT74_01770 [Flavobacteriales bacterium]|nr:hypothetical protein [Flavobacteriales bacterium]
MDWRRRFSACLFFFFAIAMGFSVPSHAQVDTETHSEIIDGIDYGGRRFKEPPPEVERDVDWDIPEESWWPGWGSLDLFSFSLATLLVWAGIIFICIILIILIVKAVGAGQSDSKIQGVDAITLNMEIDQLEENLEESDLEKALRLALASGNYKAAIRIWYLASIKELNRGGFIFWKKDKTNRQYIRELYGSALQRDFQKITLVFEKVWYGEYEIGKESYDYLKDDFSAFLNKLEGNAQ